MSDARILGKPMELEGKITAVADISNDILIAHRITIDVEWEPALTCISFDYETSFSKFVGKSIKLEAFLDEVDTPEESFQERELIIKRFEIVDPQANAEAKRVIAAQ